MTIFEAVRQSLALLDAKDRRKLAAATLVQLVTAVLDLLGVLLLGLVGAIAVTTAQNQPPPPAVQLVVTRIGLGQLTNEQLLLGLALAGAVLFLTKSLLSSYFIRRIFLFLAARQAAVSAMLAGALLSRPLTFVLSRSSQSTAYALVQGVSSATLITLGQGVIFISELTLLLLLAIGLLLIDPIIAIASIAFFGIVAFTIQLLLGRWAGSAGESLASTDVSSLDAIQEAMSAYREISVSNRRGLYVDRLQRLRLSAARSAADLQFVSTLPKYIFEVALVVGGFALAVVLLSTREAAAAVGTLALFLAAATRIMPSILRLQGAALTIRNATGIASSTIQLAAELDVADVRTLGPESSQIPPVSGEDREFRADVHVESVSFTYPDSLEPAVSGVSLYAPSGSSVALVGASGAGKSTLADLILGVLIPERGQVLIGSTFPGEVAKRWEGSLAYVPQDVALANGTVRSNVALGLPRDCIDDALVWEALDRAHLAMDLRRTREGLDTRIGERGMKLSGGQRQRLGIARALYTSPQLMVLDEATSALDAETERAIQDTLAELEGSVTTILIAHRLSTVRSADQVAYLERGVVLAKGSFDEVREAVPAFDQQARIMGLA